MKQFRCVTAIVICLGVITSCDATIPFSWATLPVFFHSANTTGPWSDEAVTAIAKFPMATFEKSHAWASRTGNETEDTLGPIACRRVRGASEGKTSTVFYLNSAIDWPFLHLHELMESHPEFQAVDQNGDPIIIVGQLAFNHSVTALRKAWVSTCLDAVEAGCNGCFIDRSNNLTQLNSSMVMTPAQAAQYAASHMQALEELNEGLAAKGGFAINNNGAEAPNGTMIMLEDFAASEHCINVLQLVVDRGLAVQAHAGDLPDNSTNQNQCIDGDVNAMSAFLVGAGEHTYYHCAPGWSSDPKWPSVSDYWLDWLPSYDRPLGAPTGRGAKGADGVWRRSFKAGTHVAFDPRHNNGTIWWGDGTVSVGNVLSPPTTLWDSESAQARPGGCAWVSL